MRDDLRDYVVEHLGDERAILVVDETGFLKKGTESVGVKRQYTGTAGKKENCQVGVFLCYAGPKGTAFIDRELYLPEEWAADGERREKAGVPEEVGFETKPQLAHRMLKRALEAGARAAWVVADCLYGDTRRLGVWLEEREQPYVLAVSGKAHVWVGLRQHKVGTILDALREGRLLVGEGEEPSWERLSCGSGSKGDRLYEWIRLPLNRPLQEGFCRWLLVRRQIDDPDNEFSAYVVFAFEDTSLEELARVAGSRWQIEVAFEGAKGEVGLDHYEVRSSGMAGIGTSPLPCSPTPSSPSSGPAARRWRRSKKGIPNKRWSAPPWRSSRGSEGSDTAYGAGGEEAFVAIGIRPMALGRGDALVVEMA